MNPYAPPEAKLADPAAAPGSPIKAVLLGLGVDIGGSVIATLILAIAYGMYLGTTGASPEEIAAASARIPPDSWLFYASAAAGCAFSVLGGYVCARTAKRSEYTLGAILAVVSSAFGLWAALDEYSLGTILSLTLAGIGAVLFGARLGYLKNRGAPQ
jgi:hypothetical protein